jgi:hypothetical protein
MGIQILIPGGASAHPDPPIKSAWRPPNMDMYAGIYIYIYPYYGYNIQNIYPYFGNLGTNAANASVRILTYHRQLHPCFVDKVENR